MHREDGAQFGTAFAIFQYPSLERRTERQGPAAMNKNEERGHHGWLSLELLQRRVSLGARSAPIFLSHFFDLCVPSLSLSARVARRRNGVGLLASQLSPPYAYRNDFFTPLFSFSYQQKAP